MRRMGPPPELVPIIQLFAHDPEVTAAPGMATVCLKAKGKIFAMINKGRLVVKLPRPTVDGLEAAGLGQRFDPGTGRIMKEWIAVDPEHRQAWPRLAQDARSFVAG